MTRTSLRLLCLVAIVIGVLTPRVADAASILPPKAEDWQYTFCTPGDDSWRTGGAAGCTWAEGDAPFGNTVGWNGLDHFDWETLWTADGADGDDLWVRRTIDVTGYDPDSVAWGLGVDNGFKLYLNGNLVASGIAEDFTFRWEYVGALPGLNPGINWIAVALEDHGIATAFDMEITGRETRQGDPVPEPGTIALLGLGSLALLASRKRLF